MSGRKTFTAGEVLQAADVNDFLMDQSVMVFAGTAARGSAIPSPSEGMVTYLSDTDEVQVFDGSTFNTLGGGLVAVKSAIFTGTQSASVGSGGNVAITDLSITHELADASNKLIISAFAGKLANSSDQRANVGLGVHDGTSLIAIGDTAGNRTRITAGGRVGAQGDFTALSNSITFVHSPGAGSKTYTLRAINPDAGTITLYINRNEGDGDAADRSRAVSALVIQEVSV